MIWVQCLVGELRSHVPLSNWAWQPQLLSPRAVTKEYTAIKIPRDAAKTRCSPMCTVLSHFGRVQLSVTPWTVPARPFCPRDSPGKNNGVGCRFLLQCSPINKNKQECTPTGPSEVGGEAGQERGSPTARRSCSVSLQEKSGMCDATEWLSEERTRWRIIFLKENEKQNKHAGYYQRKHVEAEGFTKIQRDW